MIPLARRTVEVASLIELPNNRFVSMPFAFKQVKIKLFWKWIKYLRAM